MNSEMIAILTSFVLLMVFGVLIICYNGFKAEKKVKKSLEIKTTKF